jgi:hypothetical protein
MRFGQDICIALVLAVVGAGLGKPALARSDADEDLAIVENAMAQNGLSDAEMARVRELIAVARGRERAGDEDGAVSALAAASVILRVG